MSVELLHCVPSVPLHAGHLTGTATWDLSLQTYVAELQVFNHVSHYPPNSIRHGLRTAEFITIDALTNHLGALGLGIDWPSAAKLDDLARWVGAFDGHPEFVGLTGDNGEQMLYLLTPSKIAIPIGPRLAHSDYGHQWGDTSPATLETARVLCGVAWARQSSLDSESFALALTYEVLAEAGPDFSIDANSLCDWLLADTPIATGLSQADRNDLRDQMGLGAASLAAA